MSESNKIMKIKTIGVLTSGGDAPGMNAATRSVVRYALKQGLRVFLIHEGYYGLVKGDGYIEEANVRSVADIVHRSGTRLLSAPRGFRFEKGDENGSYVDQAVATCIRLGIDSLITIGGDGTFRGASDLCAKGIRCIGIPATIDNDITASDYSIGFDSAVNSTIGFIDPIRNTCESHGRCVVAEVMGKYSGYIAVQAAIGVGAMAVAVKERPFDEEGCIRRIIEAKKLGKRQFIVVVAEGTDDPHPASDPFTDEETAEKLKAAGYVKQSYAQRLAKKIQEATTLSAEVETVETKYAIPGHSVRGCTPTARDRLIAAQMGVRAVDMLLEGMENVFVCLRNEKITYCDIRQAVTTDRLYKSTFMKVKGDIDAEVEAYGAEKAAEIRAFVKLRQAEMSGMLGIADAISSYEEPNLKN